MSYALEWVPGAVLLGVLPLLISPSFALIGLVVVALAAVAALVALVGAMLAMPYLLVRFLRRSLAERRQPVGDGLPDQSLARRVEVAANPQTRSPRSSG